MGLFENFPYTNFQNLNLDFILRKMQELLKDMHNLDVALDELKKYVEDQEAQLQENVKEIIQEWIDDGTFAGIVIDSLAKSSLNFTSALIEGGKTVVMLGDSIAEGYGWWGGEPENKTDANDGIFALWRQQYANNTFANVSVSGSTLATISGYQSIAAQISNIPKNPNFIFVWGGINDVTVSISAKKNYVGEVPLSLDSTNVNLQDTACNALLNILTQILTTYPDAHLFYIVPPTTDYNIPAYQNAYDKYKQCCALVGVPVIDTYAIYPQWTVAKRQNLNFNRIHPGQKGYEYLEKIIKKSADSEYVQTEKNIYGKIVNVNADFANMNSEDHNTAISAISAMITNNIDLFLYYVNEKLIITESFNLFGFLEIKHLHNRDYLFTYTQDILGKEYNLLYNGTTVTEIMHFAKNKAPATGNPISIFDLDGVGAYTTYPVPTELTSYYSSGFIFILYSSIFISGNQYIAGLVTGYGTGSKSYIYVGYKTSSSSTLKLREITTGKDIVIQ